jgi:hypothetical protein
MFVYACALLLCTPSLNTIEVVLVMERILQRSRSAAAVNLDRAVLETDALVLNRCGLAFRTVSLLIRKDLTISHTSVAVIFTSSDASISCSTTLVMASNAIRSSCSVTSPGSMASQRFLACSLIFMINAHSV